MPLDLCEEVTVSHYLIFANVCTAGFPLVSVNLRHKSAVDSDLQRHSNIVSCARCCALVEAGDIAPYGE